MRRLFALMAFVALLPALALPASAQARLWTSSASADTLLTLDGASDPLAFYIFVPDSGDVVLRADDLSIDLEAPREMWEVLTWQLDAQGRESLFVMLQALVPKEEEGGDETDEAG